MLNVANVIIYRKKAYIPSSGKTPAGFYRITDPVRIANVNAHEIETALDANIATGHPTLSDLSREELQKRKDPLLDAAGVRSYGALAKSGQSYAILWESDRIRMIPSTRDAKGRWVDDHTMDKTFAKDTPLSAIVKVILEDARSRPDLELQHLPGIQ